MFLEPIINVYFYEFYNIVVRFIYICSFVLKMATANPVEEIEREDNFELELKRVRENVKSTFLELFECLKRRENELLSELDKILESYHSYRNEIVKITQKKKDLEKLKQFNEQECNLLQLKE